MVSRRQRAGTSLRRESRLWECCLISRELFPSFGAAVRTQSHDLGREFECVSHYFPLSPVRFPTRTRESVMAIINMQRKEQEQQEQHSCSSSGSESGCINITNTSNSVYNGLMSIILSVQTLRSLAWQKLLSALLFLVNGTWLQMLYYRYKGLKKYVYT